MSFGPGPGVDLLWLGAADRTYARILPLGDRTLAARIRTMPDAAHGEALLAGGARIEAVEAVAARLASAGALTGNGVPRS